MVEGGPSGRQQAENRHRLSARALLLYLAGVFFLTLQDAAAKWLTDHYPANEIVFFRACFSLLAIAGFVLASRRQRSLATRHPGLQLLRGALIAATILLSILGLQQLSLAMALALSYAAPLFLTLLSALLLGETVSAQRWCAVLIGFVGALIILQPTSRDFQPAGLYILGSALTYALAVVLTRRLTRTESTLSILTYGILTTALLSGLSLPLAFATPTAAHLPILVALGIGGAISTGLFVLALRDAEVSTLAPMDYTGLVWGGLLGFAIWRDLPSLSTCLGAAIIVGVGVYIYRRTDRPPD